MSALPHAAYNSHYQRLNFPIKRRIRPVPHYQIASTSDYIVDDHHVISSHLLKN